LHAGGRGWQGGGEMGGAALARKAGKR
jgi:hypothetical protein